MPSPALLPIDKATRPAWLDDLQGNTLKGHGRDHTLHLLLQFNGRPAAELRQAIQQLVAADFVTPMSRQLDESQQFNEFDLPGRLFVNLLLSKSGYEALGFAGEAIPADPSFRLGMKADATRNKLSDPPTDQWQPGLADRVDAMLLLADDDSEFLGRQAREILTKFIDAIARVVAVEKGAAIRNDRGETIEHFGYVDGRSQPVFFQSDFEVEKKHGGTANWDPAAPPELILVHDPNSGDDQPLGSYFVFRKLEQNVREFKRAESVSLASALKLTGEDAELAGAMAVGRFEDGTPVTLQKGAGTDDPVLNNFNYKDDVAGSKCPFHAHVRKVNPRNLPESAEDVPFEPNSERSRRIARRGITYGERARSTLEIDDLDQLPSGNVGLLFMCFQASIENQFEFMQQSWANNVDFPVAQTGIDPVIGQAAGEKPTPPNPPAVAQQWPTEWADEDFKKSPKAPLSFGGFVRLLGGEYFFAPSLSFLRQITNPPAPPIPVPPVPPPPPYGR